MLIAATITTKIEHKRAKIIALSKYVQNYPDLIIIKTKNRSISAFQNDEVKSIKKAYNR